MTHPDGGPDNYLRLLAVSAALTVTVVAWIALTAYLT